MSGLQLPLEPFESGLLDVGDGHRLHWEICGNPDGKPALVLHGGPGSGCTATHRRSFAPDRYRIVLFDQRGSGRSTPHASEGDSALQANTTWHLVADIEQLRQHLQVDTWVVFGHSWGSTLGLAYAQKHPSRVHALVLAAVCATTSADIDWLYHGVGRFLPEEWSRFCAGVPEGERDGDLVTAYHRLLSVEDDEVRSTAARNWCAWEDAVVRAGRDDPPDPRYDDPVFRLAFARLVTHYFVHRAWLRDDELIDGADRLAGIPGVLVHGRLDLGSPLRTAWTLAKRWPGSELVVVDDAGHSTATAGMARAIADATDRFARLR